MLDVALIGRALAGLVSALLRGLRLMRAMFGARLLEELSGEYQYDYREGHDDPGGSAGVPAHAGSRLLRGSVSDG